MSGQEQFMSFILDNVMSEHVEDAKALLSESFAKQQDGSFDKEYIEHFIPTMISYIKEDARPQVMQIMSQFKDKM